MPAVNGASAHRMVHSVGMDKVLCIKLVRVHPYTARSACQHHFYP
ncbi:hypothetical protein [Candidatus Aalborgicola defluviihabitans]